MTRTRTAVTVVVAVAVIALALWAGLQLFGTRDTVERKPGGVERIDLNRDT